MSGTEDMHDPGTTLTVFVASDKEGLARPVRPLRPERVAEVARHRLQEAASGGQATSAAWRELREVALGLVDGSCLPERYGRASRGGAAEVVHPDFVVGPPGDVYQLETGARIGLVDVEQAAAIIADIETYRQAEREEPAPSGGRHAAKSRRARATDEPDDPFAPFLAWLEQRQRTFLWQVASRVVDLKQQARARAQHAEKTIADAAPPLTQRLQSTEHFVVVAWGLAVATAALFLVLKTLSGLDDPGGVFSAVPDVEWFDLAQVVFVVLVVLLTAGTLYFQAIRSYDWAVTQRVHTLQRAGDEYVEARHQEHRWQVLQAGLADWAAVLSELLHRPWAPPVLSDYPLPVDISPPITRDDLAIFQPVRRQEL